MATFTERDLSSDWTAADLVARFGPIPLRRVRREPPPGTATEADFEHQQEQGGMPCELVEGTLLEKTMGTYESYLAVMLAALLGRFLAENKLGFLLGADGAIRLAEGLVRLPDVSFISWQRLGEKEIPNALTLNICPDLAVEIISPSNTPVEMEHKLRDYFTHGCHTVWYVYPEEKQVHVFTGLEQRTILEVGQTLTGGEVLPGFTLSLAELFAPVAPQG